jgi:signal transduction histidine kinase
MINSSLDINEVLDNSMRVVEELIDAEASSVFEIDFEKNELFFRLVRGTSGGRARKIRMKMGEGTAGCVASTGDALIVLDTKKDKRFSKKVDELTGFKTRSIIAVPIRNRGRITGVLEVLNKRGSHSFDRNDLEMVTIVANQIGIAIENAKLYSRLKVKFELTESELKKYEANLIQAERLAALGELSKGVAHVIRNPIMSIGGSARRIRKKFALESSAQRYIDLILSETERLAKIAEDVREYTSMPNPHCTQVRLSVLLQRVLTDWKQMKSSEDITIDVKQIPEDPLVFVDMNLMSKAVIHLLSNAQNAVSKGEHIVLSTAWEDKWLSISIRDSGTGIAADELPFVFDPFFTNNTYGSGLGLTTVHRIVSGHRGEVKIVSDYGVGTEVKIFLPPFQDSM